MFYKWRGEALVLKVRLQAGASRDEIAGVVSGPSGDQLKIRLRAAPIEGRANRALLALLATAFGVSKSRVKIISGDSNRNKRVQIDKPKTLPQWLKQQFD